MVCWRSQSGYGLGKHNILAINKEGKIIYFTNDCYGYTGFVYGDLDDVVFEIKGGKLRITKNVDLNNGNLSLEIKNYIDSITAVYEQKMKDLESKMLDLEDRTEDLEDLENRIINLENQIDD